MEEGEPPPRHFSPSFWPARHMIPRSFPKHGSLGAPPGLQASWQPMSVCRYPDRAPRCSSCVAGRLSPPAQVWSSLSLGCLPAQVCWRGLLIPQWQARSILSEDGAVKPLGRGSACLPPHPSPGLSPSAAEGGGKPLLLSLGSASSPGVPAGSCMPSPWGRDGISHLGEELRLRGRGKVVFWSLLMPCLPLLFISWGGGRGLPFLCPSAPPLGSGWFLTRLSRA